MKRGSFRSSGQPARVTMTKPFYSQPYFNAFCGKDVDGNDASSPRSADRLSDEWLTLISFEQAIIDYVEPQLQEDEHRSKLRPQNPICVHPDYLWFEVFGTDQVVIGFGKPQMKEDEEKVAGTYLTPFPFSTLRSAFERTIGLTSAR